jgi:Xaa-Pro aminopeptidase
MLTQEGCRGRVQRLLDTLKPASALVLADPLHLRYFANAYADPFSLGADYTGVLLITPDGRTNLIHDHRAPKSYEQSWADVRLPVQWYDGQSPGQGPRRMILAESVAKYGYGDRIHDSLTDPEAVRINAAVAELRRCKGEDEIALLKQCMKAGEAGQAWASQNVQPGMTELDVYNGIFAACTSAAGRPVIVYGDFAVSPGPARRGGMATEQIIKPGDMLILDFSVVLQGYRSDFTNTLVVGAEPTMQQQRLYDVCLESMTAAEADLQPGTPCQAVYDAVWNTMNKHGLAEAFPHHAGHGLGLAHPEAPFFVKRSTELLQAGDVVTLEPGLYVEYVGGVRLEHNYLITSTGFECLSHHALGPRGV